MVTFYCPNCWSFVLPEMKRCPECGYDLEAFSELSYEDKLLNALSHPIQENRVMAIQILGEIGSQKALPKFEAMLNNEKVDVYVVQAILWATSKIGGAESSAILKKARRHSSSLVRNLAEKLGK